MRIAIIGCGNLGTALAKVLSKKYDVTVTRRNVEKIRFLRDLGCEILRDNTEAVKNSDIVMLTLKKRDVLNVLNQLKKYMSSKLVISFVAGLRFKDLKFFTEKPVKAMTTMSAEFEKGITLYYSELRENDETVVERVLSSFGDVVKCSEREVDMLTAFSSSIAFIAKLYEAFVYSGLKLGFNFELSKKIALNVFDGSSELLKFYEPDEIIEKVTTPAGTTIEGLYELFRHNVEFGIMEAVAASARKLSEL